MDTSVVEWLTPEATEARCTESGRPPHQSLQPVVPKSQADRTSWKPADTADTTPPHGLTSQPWARSAGYRATIRSILIVIAAKDGSVTRKYSAKADDIHRRLLRHHHGHKSVISQESDYIVTDSSYVPHLHSDPDVRQDQNRSFVHPHTEIINRCAIIYSTPCKRIRYA
ncbi:hypothetical protein KCU85_g347, partial [Aureobasidium melanogenum]